MIAECGDAHRLFAGCSLYFCAFDTHNSVVTAELVVLLVVVVTALAFDFTNGFHDTGNAMATSIATGALRPKVAVALSATLNLVGAFLSVEVAATVAKGVVNLGSVSGEALLLIVFAGLVGGILWNLATWLFGMPSSSSHALFGGLIGAAIASIGMSGVEWGGVMGKVILPALLAPVVAALVAAVGTKLIYRITRDVPDDTKGKGFRIGQVGTASLVSLAHGTNDAQKTMGVIFLALLTGGYVAASDPLPIWVIVVAATAISLGTYSGGWRIMRTLGRRIIHLDPPRGFAAESVAASVLYTTSYAFEAPISTTHTITSAVMGVGATKRFSAVRWGVARGILVAWVLTFPAAGLVAALVYWLCRFVFQLP